MVKLRLKFSTHSGDSQIIRISADGATRTVIDTQDATNGRINFTNPMINDAGLVAYKGIRPVQMVRMPTSVMVPQL